MYMYIMYIAAHMAQQKMFRTRKTNSKKTQVDEDIPPCQIHAKGKSPHPHPLTAIS
jgi:hypothetical protein